MKSGDQAQERCFSAPGRAEEGEKLPVLNFQRHLADRFQGAKSLNKASKQDIHKQPNRRARGERRDFLNFKKEKSQIIRRGVLLSAGCAPDIAHAASAATSV
jgi:hypothetical protein